MGGVATASYVALIMRTAPPGLQGTMMMSASSVYFIATRFGDVIGSALYRWLDDFTICIILSTAIYATILLLLPSSPSVTMDAEAASTALTLFGFCAVKHVIALVP